MFNFGIVSVSGGTFRLACCCIGMQVTRNGVAFFLCAAHVRRD